MKIVIPVYREISWILPIYMHLHNKYWNEKVTIIGEEQYLLGKKNVESIGLKFINYDTTPSDLFSDVLIWYLQQIDDNQVIIMMADYLLTNQVNVAMIYKILDYMDNNPDVLRCQLGDFTISNSKLFIENYRGVDIYERGFHPTNLTPGMWNRHLLLKILEHFWTAWDVENHCHDKYLLSRMRSICPIPEPVNYINALRNRNTDTLVVNDDALKEIEHLIPDNVEVYKTKEII